MATNTSNSTSVNKRPLRLSAKERIQLIKEGKYFKYRKLGYIGKDYPNNYLPTAIAPIQKPTGP